MTLIACDSPLALATFALAVAWAWTTVWFATTCIAQIILFSQIFLERYYF